MFKEILNKYKKLSDEDKNNLILYDGFKGVYDCNDSISDEDAIFILDLSYNVWRKSEGNNNDLYEYANFLTNAFSNRGITKEQLNSCNRWDIMEAVCDDDTSIIEEAYEESINKDL